MPKIADRLLQLGTESALDVLLRARALEAQGRAVIHLEVGEPDFPTPRHIVEAGVKALREGKTRYGPAPGSPALREAVCDGLRARGIGADIDRVLIAPGAKPILFYGFLAAISPGDEVIVPDPGFPIYPSMVRFCGGVPVPVEPADPSALERAITPRTRMLVLNSPSNPTGSMLSDAEVARLAELCERHDLWVLSDEIYRRISYEKEPLSIASLPGMGERAIVVDGFSKSYAMTGWRLGWGLFPPALAAHAVRLMINSNTCTATFVQEAGLAALRGPQECVREMTAEFRRRRDVIVPRLQRIEGLRCHLPAGAFYAFPDLRGLPLSSAAFADRLLAEEGVALLDGAGFGDNGAGHVRLSFAASMENLEEAAHRIERLLSLL